MMLYCSASWCPHILWGYFCFQNWSWVSKLENEINVSDEAAIFYAWNLGKTLLAPGINLFMIKINCWDTSIHSFDWRIYLGFIYYYSVLLLSNQEYGTRFHPRVSGSPKLSAWVFPFFFSQTGTVHIASAVVAFYYFRVLTWYTFHFLLFHSTVILLLIKEEHSPHLRPDSYIYLVIVQFGDFFFSPRRVRFGIFTLM